MLFVFMVAAILFFMGGHELVLGVFATIGVVTIVIAILAGLFIGGEMLLS